MEQFLALKRNEELIHTTTWMTLENMWGDRSQTQSPHTYDFIYMKCPEEATTLERQIVGQQFPGVVGKGESVQKGYRISLQRDENVLKLDVVMVVQLCEYTKNMKSYTLNG